jgi:ABC-type transport system substrate-binding protein
LAALLACGFAACEASDAGPAVDQRAASDDADIARGSSEPIVIALPQLPRKFDPLDDMEPWASRIADDLVFEGLVRRTSDRHPWAEPAIADRCELDPNYGVALVTCHIPRGVRFHDGSELTMADVEYSLRYWLHERRSWLRQRHGLSGFVRVEIVDAPRGAPAELRDRGRWVRVVFDRDDPLALEALSAIKIVPMAGHRGRAGRFARAPIGTGPMRMTTLAPDRIVLEPFEGHRAARPDAPSKITFRAIDDGAVALTALRRGEVHLLAELAANHVPVELGKPGMAGRFRAWLVSPASYDVLLWNVGKGLFADAELRTALHDAIPRAAIARRIYGSPSLPSTAPVDLHEPTPIDLHALIDIKLGEPVRGGLHWFPANEDDRIAAERSAASLERLGWRAGSQGLRRRSGGPLRINLIRDEHDGLPALLSEAIRGTWQAIGVRAPDTANSWRFLFAMLQNGNFRVALLRLGIRSDEDLFELFHSRGANNFARVADDRLDEALRDYQAALDRVARDAAKRRIAARLAELCVVSILHAPAHVTLASRRLGELEFIDDLPRLDTLTLDPGPVEWARG